MVEEKSCLEKNDFAFILEVMDKIACGTDGLHLNCPDGHVVVTSEIYGGAPGERSGSHCRALPGDCQEHTLSIVWASLQCPWKEQHCSVKLDQESVFRNELLAPCDVQAQYLIAKDFFCVKSKSSTP